MAVIDLELGKMRMYCSFCGDGLDAEVVRTDDETVVNIMVHLCKNCVEEED